MEIKPKRKCSKKIDKIGAIRSFMQPEVQDKLDKMAENRLPAQEYRDILKENQELKRWVSVLKETIIIFSQPTDLDL